MEGGVVYENDLNLKATELTLGLPGTERNQEQAVSCARNNKRPLPESRDQDAKSDVPRADPDTPPAPK